MRLNWIQDFRWGGASWSDGCGKAAWLLRKERGRPEAPGDQRTAGSLTAAERGVEVLVRGTQEADEARFHGSLRQDGQRLVAAEYLATETRVVLQQARDEPRGAAAQAVVTSEALDRMRAQDERHESGSGALVVLGCALLAGAAELGFMYSSLSRSLNADAPWMEHLRVWLMAVALATVTVVLADQAGRMCRPLWSDWRDRSALARAAVPVALTIAASVASWNLIYSRFTVGTRHVLPAPVIATLVVLLVWMVLLLESQRPSRRPLFDPRVTELADSYQGSVNVAERDVLRADAGHHKAWLILADRVDSCLRFIQTSYVTGAVLVLEDHGRCGERPSGRLYGSADDAYPVGPTDYYAAREAVPAIENSVFLARRFHHVERAMSLLSRHMPATLSGAQGRLLDLYQQLGELKGRPAVPEVQTPPTPVAVASSQEEAQS